MTSCIHRLPLGRYVARCRNTLTIFASAMLMPVLNDLLSTVCLLNAQEVDSSEYYKGLLLLG